MTIENVGAQDPERTNSPIVEETLEEDATLRQQIPGEAVCYFNDRAFDQDTLIRSGTLLLRCDRGIWIPVGGSDPDNP